MISSFDGLRISERLPRCPFCMCLFDFQISEAGLLNHFDVCLDEMIRWSIQESRDDRDDGGRMPGEHPERSLGPELVYASKRPSLHSHDSNVTRQRREV